MKKVLTLMLTVMLMFMLAVSAMPVGFTPSVEGIEAPEPVVVIDDAGNRYVGVLTDEDGSETPVAPADEDADINDSTDEGTDIGDSAVENAGDDNSDLEVTDEAPETDETTDSEGNGNVTVPTGNEGSETTVPAADEGAGANEVVLEVTAVSKADDAPTSEIADQLIAAAETIKNADSVTDLVPEIAGALEVIKAASTDPAQKEVTIADLVVHDLFDVSLLKNGEVIEVPEGGSIRFSLKTTLKPGDIFFVIHNYEGDKWELINDVVLADDGTLTVTVNSLSPFAIISVGAPAAPAVESGATVPVSPQTGDSFPTMYLVFAVLFAAASAVFFIKARKHSA